MALTKQKKQEVIKYLEEKLSKQKSVVFADFTGLNVAQTTQLRKQLREKGLDYKVAKKTLLKIALDNIGLKDMNVLQFDRSCAVTVSYDDELAPANTIYDFAKQKENKSMQILGGIFENRFIPKEEVVKLAKIPSREALITQIAMMFNSPMRSFAVAINALKEQKEKV